MEPFEHGGRLVTVAVVAAKKENHRRLGRVFTRESVDIPLIELTEDDLRTLQADPWLYCALVGEAGDGQKQETNTDANLPPALENPQPVPPAETTAPTAGTIASNGNAGASGDEGGGDHTAADTGANDHGSDDGAGAVLDNTPESDDVAAKGAARESAAPAKAAPKRAPAKASPKKDAAK